MTTSEIIALCALAVSALMMLMSMRRGSQSDAASQARQETKLDNVAHGVEDIRVDMRSLKNELSTHSAELAEVKVSLKNAHRRIEEIFALYRKAHPPDTHHTDAD